jgi:hypothetical protein
MHRHEWRICPRQERHLGLITKVLSCLKCTVWYLNKTIMSKWDILQNIVSSLQLFPTLPSIVHVKGHQDNALPHNQLPLEAQVNVDAATAATEYQTMHGKSRPIVPSITSYGAQLLILDKTVTHHYIREIQHAYSHPLLKAYIRKRNQWPPMLLSQINWSLGTACNALHNQRHFVVKLSHNLLPTQSCTTKYDASSPSECPFCLTGIEDRDYLCHAVEKWGKLGSQARGKGRMPMSFFQSVNQEALSFTPASHKLTKQFVVERVIKSRYYDTL